MSHATNYIPDLYHFLHQVAANNNRPWFAEHKDEYLRLRELWMADLDRLIAHMTLWEPGLATQSAKTCAYRFYRDTRFSTDKSPYKLFFSAAISPFGRKTRYAGYYVQVGVVPGESGLYGGIWMPDSAMLKKLRTAIIDNLEEWQECTDTPEINRYFPGWCDSYSLKTVPKGYPKDHPQANLLRLRQYGKQHEVGMEFFSNPDWPRIASDRLRLLKPMVDFINYSLDEEV